MDTATKTTTNESFTDKQCTPTRQSQEASDVQSEVSVDYAGASRKTDPAEIALVKKLDLCMMVSFRSLNCFTEVIELIRPYLLTNDSIYP